MTHVYPGPHPTAQGTPGRRLSGAAAGPVPPRPRPAVLAAIAGGGFAGGLARYAIGTALPTAPRAFPWTTLLVDAAGTFAFVALLVLTAAAAPRRPLLRPALGTGFCGAFTTFSSVVAAADQLAAHGRLGTAAAYLAASLAAAFTAAWAALAGCRALAGRR